MIACLLSIIEKEWNGNRDQKAVYNRPNNNMIEMVNVYR